MKLINIGAVVFSPEQLQELDEQDIDDRYYTERDLLRMNGAYDDGSKAEILRLAALGLISEHK